MNSLISRLAHDYPQFHFIPADCARWSNREQTIYYTDDNQQTLHELGHALLGHQCYHQDIELLKLERAAWEVAAQLAPHYGLSINSNTIEDALDSYREWLHGRSRCPKCGQTGWQSVNDLSYHCPNCQTSWVATDGRQHRTQRRTQK